MRFVAVFLVCAGCIETGEVPPADQIACTYFENGPFQEVPVGDSRDSTAPLLDEGTALRLTTTGGYVSLGVDDASDVGLYASDEVTLEVTDDTGAVVTPTEEQTSSAGCDQVQRRVVVPLEVGLYYVEITGGAPPFDLVTQTFAIPVEN